MESPSTIDKDTFIPFGSLLDESEIKEFNANSNVVEFNKKEIIFRQNTRTSHIMFIKSGMVKIFKEGRNGKFIILKVAVPGPLVCVHTPVPTLGVAFNT